MVELETTLSFEVRNSMSDEQNAPTINYCSTCFGTALGSMFGIVLLQVAFYCWYFYCGPGKGYKISLVAIEQTNVTLDRGRSMSAIKIKINNTCIQPLKTIRNGPLFKIISQNSPMKFSPTSLKNKYDTFTEPSKSENKSLSQSDGKIINKSDNKSLSKSTEPPSKSANTRLKINAKFKT